MSTLKKDTPANAILQPQTTQESNTGENKEQTDSVTLHIKVVQATNIKGSKGDHVNSFVRVQFADFDFKDVL